MSSDLQMSGGTRRSKMRSPKTIVLLAVCGVAAVSAIALQVTAPGFAGFRGVAELIEYHPSARQAERVTAIPVEVGQRVRAGDVVAQLDVGPTSRELEMVIADLTRAQAEVDSQRIQIARRSMFEQRRFLGAVETAEIARLQARIRHDADQADLGSLKQRIEWWQPMVEAQAAPGQTLQDLKANATAIEQRLSLDAEAVKSWGAVVDRTRGRAAAYDNAAPSGEAVEASLAPYIASVEMLKARRGQIQEKLSGLTLRSPGDGVVYKIQVRPGDVAMPGAPVVQIRAQSSRLVLVYVSDVVASMVAPGTPVSVVPRDARNHTLKGHTLALGSGVRPLPDQVLMNPNWREFGQEVVVELDEAGALAPGQIVDARFDLKHTPKTQIVPQAEAAAPPPKAVDDQPALAEVPSALRERTRIEPSGLVWVPEMDRFLVVSDDTGQPERNDHAPWLLTMTRQGRFDDNPVVVEGVSTLNDLESIVRSPDGTIWVLSSQSVSRQGNRKEERTLLVTLRPQNGKLRVMGKASLSAALATAGDATWLASLGLTTRAPNFEKGVAGFDRELNIEGMTWDNGGLLLGLKRPLGDDGRAIVWRMAHPEKLIASARIDRADLTVHARVALKVGPVGHEVPAGISDLLKLPDGGVAVLGVALRSADSAQPFPGDWSALHVVAPPAPAGDWSARKVRDFSGLKAEGVAYGPAGGVLTVIFDRDGETPRWTTVPVPQ
jgi:multidrug resistance efflux pump